MKRLKTPKMGLSILLLTTLSFTACDRDNADNSTKPAVKKAIPQEPSIDSGTISAMKDHGVFDVSITVHLADENSETKETAYTFTKSTAGTDSCDIENVDEYAARVANTDTKNFVAEIQCIDNCALVAARIIEVVTIVDGIRGDEDTFEERSLIVFEKTNVDSPTLSVLNRFTGNDSIEQMNNWLEENQESRAQNPVVVAMQQQMTPVSESCDTAKEEAAFNKRRQAAEESERKLREAQKERYRKKVFEENRQAAEESERKLREAQKERYRKKVFEENRQAAEESERKLREAQKERYRKKAELDKFTSEEISRWDAAKVQKKHEFKVKAERHMYTDGIIDAFLNLFN